MIRTYYVILYYVGALEGGAEGEGGGPRPLEPERGRQSRERPGAAQR